MIHAARALGLGVMIGCMVESQLGGGARPRTSGRWPTGWTWTATCCWPSSPTWGCELRDGRVLPSDAARASGWSRRERAAGHLRRGPLREPQRQDRPRRDPLRQPRRGGGGGLHQRRADAPPRSSPSACATCPMVASVAEAIERGATTLLIGVAPTGGKLDPAWRPALLEAIEAGLDLEAGLHTELSADPELREAAERRGTAPARPARRAARPHRAARAREPRARGAGGAQRGLGHGDRQEGRDAGARPRRARARARARCTCPPARPAWRSRAGAWRWTT